VEVVAGHVGVELEAPGHVGRRHALARTSGVEVDLTPGRVAERVGDGADVPGEAIDVEVAGEGLRGRVGRRLVDRRDGHLQRGSPGHGRYCTYPRSANPPGVPCVWRRPSPGRR